MDAAHLQEEEATFGNKYGFSKHKPAKPLFDTDDALETLRLLSTEQMHTEIRAGEHIRVKFYHSGHILGSSLVKVVIRKGDYRRTILFTGDLGRFGVPILPNPEVPESVDLMILESTYGDRTHAPNDIGVDLAEIVHDSIRRGGVLIIPAFAIGRTQRLLYLLRELQADARIPPIPIYLDSPMAIRAVRSYSRQIEAMDEEARYLEKTGDHPLKPLNLNICNSPDESKALNNLKGNAIIISASGMATGGRILHHLKLRLPRENDTLLFIGYQAEGTRGRTIIEGLPTVKIHGKHIPIRCAVKQIDGLSAHADRDEILTWLKMFKTPPKKILLNHGETHALVALKDGIESALNIPVQIPDYLQEIEVE